MLKPIEPMLATPWPKAFDDPAWSFELKWDGIRGILHSSERAELRSRNGNSLGDRYPHLLVEHLDLVLDGEVVAMNREGEPSFGLLQQGAPTSYVVFDVLMMGDIDIRTRPWSERLEILADAELPGQFIRSDVVPGEGRALFDAIQQRNLEGIVAKRFDSLYRGGRSSQWRKIAHTQSARVIVVGYTLSESGGPFAGLMLAMWDEGALRYVGKVGTGFSNEQRAIIRASLDQMVTEVVPFEIDERFVPTEPILVAHVAFKGWTEGGKLRAPSFKGFGAESSEEVTWVGEGP